MTTLVLALWSDDAGFILSAELVLISTIAVLAMVVGMAEVAYAVNQELEDVASAFGSVNQGFRYQGLTGHSGASNGTQFHDAADFCDAPGDITGSGATSEGGGSHN